MQLLIYLLLFQQQFQVLHLQLYIQVLVGLGKFREPLGIKIVFTPIGITIALIFIGLPFVVRTVQPALEEIQIEQEEASAVWGLSRWQTFIK